MALHRRQCCDVLEARFWTASRFVSGLATNKVFQHTATAGVFENLRRIAPVEPL